MPTEKNPRILVLEDTESTWAKMLLALNEQATKQNLQIEIIHAASVNEAKQILKTELLTCASLDMVCPRYTNDLRSLQSNGGAQVAQYNQRHGNIPYLIYSSEKIAGIEKLLKDECINSLPLILRKDFSISHNPWAIALLGLIPQPE